MERMIKRPAGKAGRSDSATEKVRAGQHNNSKPRPATRIQIDADYAIGADSHSWFILQRKHRKTGDTWEPIAWYATLEQCVNGFADRAVRLSGAQTLDELLAEAQRVISRVCRALHPRYKVARS